MTSDPTVDTTWDDRGYRRQAHWEVIRSERSANAFEQSVYVYRTDTDAVFAASNDAGCKVAWNMWSNLGGKMWWVSDEIVRGPVTLSYCINDNC